jgi:hypothetical protein
VIVIDPHQEPQSSIGLIDVEPMQLGVLTEEELAVISRPDYQARRLVPLERVDAMSEHDRSMALETGRRSLTARGLLDSNGDATGPLALALAIRNHPTMIAIADRTDSEGVSHRYLYGSRDGVVLEEHVDVAAHRFTLTLRPVAAARLTAYADPARRCPEDDEDPIVRRGSAVAHGWDDVTAAVGQVETVTRLFSTRPGPRELAAINLSIVAGTRSVAAVGGYGPPAHQPDLVEPLISTRVLSRPTLTAMLVAFLDDAPLPTPANYVSCAPGELE